MVGGGRRCVCLERLWLSRVASVGSLYGFQLLFFICLSQASFFLYVLSKRLYGRFYHASSDSCKMMKDFRIAKTGKYIYDSIHPAASEVMGDSRPAV